MIWMAYACNDPDNGEPLETQFVEQIQFETEDCSIRLQGGRVKVWLETITRNGLRELVAHVGQCVVPVKTSAQWWGNSCWDAALIPDRHALKVFNYLATLKGWRCEEAPIDLFECFNLRCKVTKEQWEASIR